MINIATLNHSDDLMVLSAMGTAAIIRLPDYNATEHLQDYNDTAGIHLY